ncbi:hypothetical protein [Pseudomonas mangiferae]|uniref:Lipoprotein n=1 Tax=Pseudomonas mangiferae TaxID=2593654 RepID=A0A553GXL0_9PSED|nr:hypothetical protein [Pseudomonas mangiferae]TRX74231.1 hypothetical protein FM069_13940 [Pseudomonas mangiferae]
MNSTRLHTLFALGALLLGTSLSACAVDAPAVSPSHCDSQTPHNLRQIGDYRVLLYEPDDEAAPQAWQGPVCIEADTLAKACVLDLSLVKAVEPGPKPGTLRITTFSGSMAYRQDVDPRACPRP